MNTSFGMITGILYTKPVLISKEISSKKQKIWYEAIDLLSTLLKMHSAVALRSNLTTKKIMLKLFAGTSIAVTTIYIQKGLILEVICESE